jgi:flagellin
VRINHNIASMVTHGALYQIGVAMSTSLQRLSTGLRINAAQDDAAGLGVSENLRTQTNGLNQAIKNTQDAISLLNIADGALNEQAAILQRMRELVVQGLNGTYTSTERSYMSQEFNQLTDELDRIATVTNFNGKQLFATPQAYGDGGSYAPGEYNQDPPHAVSGQDIWASATDKAQQHPFGGNDISSSHFFNIFVGANYTAADTAAANNLGQGAVAYASTASDILTIELGQMDTNALLSPNSDAAYGSNMWRHFEGVDPTVVTPPTPIDPEDILIWNAVIADTGSTDWLVFPDGTSNVNGASSAKLNILLKVLDGSDDLTANERTQIFDNGTGVGDNNSTGLKRVNEMRAYIGAQTNRLEHAVSNMMNQQTNTQAAESLIRDVDFASETANFTRAQILSESATAMLAQANLLPENMLSLLK